MLTLHSILVLGLLEVLRTLCLRAKYLKRVLYTLYSLLCTLYSVPSAYLTYIPCLVHLPRGLLCDCGLTQRQEELSADDSAISPSITVAVTLECCEKC